jgi:arginine utilization protein RocB
LPPGVKAVWDLSKAYRETTPTRELICINGLWRLHPAEPKSQRAVAEAVLARRRQAPSENWGYFKVPGCWPGITE